MKPKLAFLTGARSDYGPVRGLLKALQEDPRIRFSAIVHSLHLEERYGTTVDEIVNDGVPVEHTVQTLKEHGGLKTREFTHTIEALYKAIRECSPDAALIVGDRLEAYGAALAVHFAGLPIVHGGGGHLTAGAVDNVYRYNITNLAALHLVTSRGAHEQVRRCPLVKTSSVHFTGSPTVDEIMAFQAHPVSVRELVPELPVGRFALMTFHPVTVGTEPTAELMQAAIDYILNHDFDILITYPNNDDGAETIWQVVESSRERPGVHVVGHLGVRGYYAALQECAFVVGNSSSGIIEAPYFHKPVINVGARQEGRDKDVGVYDIEPEEGALLASLERGFGSGWPKVSCHQLYGDGSAVRKGHESILSFLRMIKGPDPWITHQAAKRGQ